MTRPNVNEAKFNEEEVGTPRVLNGQVESPSVLSLPTSPHPIGQGVNNK